MCKKKTQVKFFRELQVPQAPKLPGLQSPRCPGPKAWLTEGGIFEARVSPGSFLYLYIFLHLLHMFLHMFFAFFIVLVNIFRIEQIRQWMEGACGAPHLLGIYFISKMHTKTIQKIQKAYIKTYEKDVKIYKDIENSQGQGAFFLW